jgi:hypothetical protein
MKDALGIEPKDLALKRKDVQNHDLMKDIREEVVEVARGVVKRKFKELGGENGSERKKSETRVLSSDSPLRSPVKIRKITKSSTVKPEAKAESSERCRKSNCSAPVQSGKKWCPTHFKLWKGLEVDQEEAEQEVE